MKKNVNIPMNKVLPVSDKLILDLLTAEKVNGKIFWYMSEDGGMDGRIEGDFEW